MTTPTDTTSRTAVLVEAALSGLRRFPLVLAAAALCAWFVIAYEFEAEIARVLLPTALALPLLLALRIIGERGRLPRALESGLTLGVIGGIALLAFLWPEWGGTQRTVRYLQLSAAAHLLLAVGPFARRGEENAFWHFNRILLTRTLGAAAYAGALFLGLAAALWAVHALFPVEVPPEPFLWLFATLSFVLTTWYIVGGLPRDFAELEALDEDPRAIRLFAQFVLVPLCALYLLILTAYLAFVLATQVWPSGWIGWLVSFMAVAGILSVLLTRPFADTPSGRWVPLWERTFWLLMLPATGMLLLAVGRRIAQYGVTEPRYFVTALALWLGAMAVAYGTARVRSLKLIPASLALLCLVTAAGPWGAASVAEGSQRARLLDLLGRNAMLEEGRAVPAATSVPSGDAGEIRSVLAWLLERGAEPGVELPEHGSRTISPTASGVSRSFQARRIADAVAIELGVGETPAEPSRRLAFSLPEGRGVPAEGFREAHVYRVGATVRLDGDPMTIQLAQGGLEVRLVGSDRDVRHRIDLRPIIAGLLARIGAADIAGEELRQPGPNEVEPGLLVGESVEDGRRVRLVIQLGSLSVPPEGEGEPELHISSGMLLVGDAPER